MAEAFDLPREQLLTYRSSTPRPDDFDEFWRTGLDELAAVDPQARIEPAEFAAPFARCESLWFYGTKGAKLHAKLWRPAAETENSPVLLCYHGLSGKSPDWIWGLPYAAAGFTVAALDCRGQAGRSQDVGGQSGSTFRGFVMRGTADDPSTAYYRETFLDTKRLADVALALAGVDPTRVGATGASQGGGLTVAAAGLDPRITHAAPVFPYLSDYRRVWSMELAKDAYFDLGAWFRLFDPLHEREAEVFTKLGYFDVAHHAANITAEVLMTVSHVDRICPPSTQFAAYNAITSTKSLREYFDFGHESLPGNDDAIFRFFVDRLLPPG